MMNKKCSKCGEVKDLNDFYKNRRKRDGKQANCKICARSITKDWLMISENRKRWREKNRDKEKERVKTWAINNPNKKIIQNVKSNLKQYHNILNPSPELIQRKVEIIKIQRLIKQIENGKD